MSSSTASFKFIFDLAIAFLSCYHDDSIKGSNKHSDLYKDLWLIFSQPQTMLNCIDNSGAAVVECVAVLRMKRHAKIGWSDIYMPSWASNAAC